VVFDAQTIILEGDLQMDIGHPEETARIYERGLALGEGTRPLFLSAMALAARAQGEDDKARALLTRALALDPSNERARAMLRELDGDAVD